MIRTARLMSAGRSNEDKMGGSCSMHVIDDKVKQSNYRPGQAMRFQEDEAPRFQDNRHMKVVRLSALGAGRLYPPGNIPGTHFC
jgi:hypothetical protein